METIKVFIIEDEAWRYGDSNGITIIRFRKEEDRDVKFNELFNEWQNSKHAYNFESDNFSFSFDDDRNGSGCKWSYEYRKDKETIEIH
jgi:hypothetical protein